MRRFAPTRIGLLLLFLLSLVAVRTARAHEIDSATLTLKEVTPGHFAVGFKAGSATLVRELAAPAVFPRHCRLHAAQLDCGPSGLVGPIEVPWLEGTLTHLLIEIDWHDGSRLLRLLSASSPRLTVYGAPSSGFAASRAIAVDYAVLGVEHILFGFDHLFFVIALTILVRGRRRLVATVTAFTAAHSITLACTVLGVWRVPAAPVEAAIGLSIVLVCVECLRPRPSLTRSAPWFVAFAFGLLHGLGFATALLETGLPEKHVPVALLCFNLGVELGQLAIVLLIAALRAGAARYETHRGWMVRSAVYLMGGIAVAWSLERLPAVFGY